MKIAIIGATGHQGRFLFDEALSRKIDVTAIVRNQAKLSKEQNKFMVKDLYNLTTVDLKDFDVVIDAFNAPKGDEEQHVSSLKHLISILNGTKVRLMVVGGAGSLFVEPTEKIQLAQTPDFPEAAYPTATNMAKGLTILEKTMDLDWTYVSPAANFILAGPRTGHYQIAGNVLKLNHEGKSEISYADYAVAMIDEAQKKEYPRQRISIVSQ